jgi:hypothetical protein
MKQLHLMIKTTCKLSGTVAKLNDTNLQFQPLMIKQVVSSSVTTAPQVERIIIQKYHQGELNP